MVDGALTTFFGGQWTIDHMAAGEKTWQGRKPWQRAERRAGRRRGQGEGAAGEKTWQRRKPWQRDERQPGTKAAGQGSAETRKRTCGMRKAHFPESSHPTAR